VQVPRLPAGGAWALPGCRGPPTDPLEESCLSPRPRAPAVAAYAVAFLDVVGRDAQRRVASVVVIWGRPGAGQAAQVDGEPA
jgi:ADP-ribose pyrophosphatase YjhB (NUDIX family)